MTMLTNLPFVAGKGYNVAAALKERHVSQAKAAAQPGVQRRPVQAHVVRAVLNLLSLRSGTTEVCVEHLTNREPQVESWLGILVYHRPHT